MQLDLLTCEIALCKEAGDGVVEVDGALKIIQSGLARSSALRGSFAGLGGQYNFQ